jgi:dipeptidyl aminopeptidase/acylaminoacyl peptidase
LTLWTITHTTQFKAAIAGGSLSDLVLFAKTTDIPWYLPAYLGNTYLENPSFYKERSPISYVQNVTTPLLMFHGSSDKRVPIMQSEEFYTALKDQNKKAKMVKMPKQGHMPTDPKIILNNMEQLDQWLNLYN